jgi:hypothetical protein
MFGGMTVLLLIGVVAARELAQQRFAWAGDVRGGQLWSLVAA